MDNKSFFTITPALSRSFWAYHVTGWLILMIIHILFRAMIPSPSVWTVWSLYLLLENSIGFSLMIGVRTLYLRIGYKELNYGFLIIILALISFSAAITWQSAYMMITYLLSGQQNLVYYLQIRWIVLNSVTYQFPIVVGWSFLYFGIKFWFDWQDQREAAEKALIAAHQAQLQMLRYRLKPNFLFNSLLTIRAILEEDKKTAKILLTDLSEFLRYSLLSRHNSIVRLCDEIEATKRYLSIEQIRYENGIIVDYEIDADTNELPVLTFLIHPVVERTVEHCVQSNSLPVQIRIKSKKNGKDLIISISTTCKYSDAATPLFKTYNETYEMVHLLERMKNVFGDKYIFDIQENNGTVNIGITIQNIDECTIADMVTLKTISPITDSAIN